MNTKAGFWFHKDYKRIPFDGDYRKRGMRRVFTLESVGGKRKIRKTFNSWQIAKSKGWVLEK